MIDFSYDEEGTQTPGVENTAGDADPSRAQSTRDGVEGARSAKDADAPEVLADNLLDNDLDDGDLDGEDVVDAVGSGALAGLGAADAAIARRLMRGPGAIQGTATPGMDEAPVRTDPLPVEVRAYIRRLDRDGLVALVETLGRTFPPVRDRLMDRQKIAAATTDQLLADARSAIDMLQLPHHSFDDYDSYYGGRYGGADPYDDPDAADFSVTSVDQSLDGIRDRLDALLARGRADDVLELAKRLLGRAGRDRGVEYNLALQEKLRRCLSVIQTALDASRLSPLQQMQWVADREIEDDFGLVPDTTAFWEAERPPEVWNGLVAALERRVNPKGKTPHIDLTDRVAVNRRDQLVNLQAYALGRAGRDDEIVPLLEREAALTRSYTRLVGFLTNADRLDEAELWAREGLRVVGFSYPSPDLLQRMLVDIYQKRGDRLGVAAFAAFDFFRAPSKMTYAKLHEQAEQAHAWDATRAHALRYLETLRRPDQTANAPSDDLPPWPLPDVELPPPVPSTGLQAPVTSVLLDIAMQEKRSADVLRWYERLPKQSWYGYGMAYGDDLDRKVAEAIRNAYPDRAVEIWTDLAERSIETKNAGGYERATRDLRRAGQTRMRQGRLAEWRATVLQIREHHKRKYTLRAMLDDLLGQFPASGP